MTLTDYYMGRDKLYASELTPELIANATETVRRATILIAIMQSDVVVFQVNPATKTIITSGWRPQAINLATKGAAPHSKHMTCQAIDIYDPDGDIDDWCMANEEQLAEVELWLEHPAATKGWSHWQTVAPRSGNRVFYP